MRASALSPIDRTLGFVFGLVRGAFIVCLAYLLLDISVQPSERPVWIQQAKSTEFLKRGADELRIFLPESLKIKTTAIDDAVRALSAETITLSFLSVLMGNPSFQLSELYS